MGSFWPGACDATRSPWERFLLLFHTTYVISGNKITYFQTPTTGLGLEFLTRFLPLDTATLTTFLMLSPAARLLAWPALTTLCWHMLRGPLASILLVTSGAYIDSSPGFRGIISAHVDAKKVHPARIEPPVSQETTQCTNHQTTVTIKYKFSVQTQLIAQCYLLSILSMNNVASLELYRVLYTIEIANFCAYLLYQLSNILSCWHFIDK